MVAAAAATADRSSFALFPSERCLVERFVGGSPSKPPTAHFYTLKPNNVPLAVQLAALETAQEQAHTVARAMRSRSGEGRLW